MMLKIVKYLVKNFLPTHTLLSVNQQASLDKLREDYERATIDYQAESSRIEVELSRVRKTLEECRAMNYEYKQHIRLLESIIDKTNGVELSKKFEVAAKQIDSLTPKAKASFLYNIVMAVDYTFIESIERYIHLKRKGDAI